MSLHRQLGPREPEYFVENRRSPRWNLEVPICIYPRNSTVIRGLTADISESGIAVMLRDELPIGEVVRLEFTLPLGPVEVHAVARQRNAFRYGLQFVEPATVQDVIGRTCRELSMEQPLSPPTPL